MFNQNTNQTNLYKHSMPTFCILTSLCWEKDKKRISLKIVYVIELASLLVVGQTIFNVQSSEIDLSRIPPASVYANNTRLHGKVGMGISIHFLFLVNANQTWHHYLFVEMWKNFLFYWKDHKLPSEFPNTCSRN